MSFFNKFSGEGKKSGEEQLLLSVVGNLNNLLNTKKGFGSFIEDFGIRDMNEFSSRQQLSAAIMDEVSRNIQKYEPRLEFEEISLLESSDNFRIAFKIKCRLRESRQALFMEFNSIGNDFYVRNER